MKGRLTFIPETIFVLAMCSSCFESDSTAQEREPQQKGTVDPSVAEKGLCGKRFEDLQHAVLEVLACAER